MEKQLNDTLLLITGAGGFLGQAFAKRCKQEKIQFVAQARKNVPGLAEELIIADLNDVAQRKHLLQKFFSYRQKNKVVFHFAGLSHIGKCEENPDKSKSVNFFLAKSLIEEITQFSSVHFVFFSTGLLYCATPSCEYCEEDLVEAHNEYTKSKLSIETELQNATKNKNINATVFRLSNVYGCGMNPDTVVSLALQCGLHTESISLRNMSPIRDFIYIDDVTDALIYFLKKLPTEDFSLFNLSTGVGIKIRTLVENIVNLLPEKKNVQIIDQQIGQANKMVLLVDKFKDQFNWQPKFNIYDGLKAWINQYV